MSTHFGLESYPGPKDCDNNTNVFILDKYRTKIESVKTTPEISVSGGAGTEVAAIKELQDRLQRLNDLDSNKSAQEDAGFGSDSGDLQEDTVNMNDITREEFNAKLETIEVKMDARVESVSAKIDAFIAVQAERDKRMEAIVNQISTTHAEIKTSINSMKTTTIVTAVSAVLAIVIGIAGFNAMLTSNMIASFQMGRSESALAASAVQSSQKAEQETPSSAQKK